MLPDAADAEIGLLSQQRLNSKRPALQMIIKGNEMGKLPKDWIGCACKLWARMDSAANDYSVLILEDYCPEREPSFYAGGAWWARCALMPDDELEKHPLRPLAVDDYYTKADIDELLGWIQFALRACPNMSAESRRVLQKAMGDLADALEKADDKAIASDFLLKLNHCWLANSSVSAAEFRLIKKRKGAQNDFRE